LSLREFNRWIKYRRDRGSLNIGLRVERSVATLSAIYANQHSKEKSFRAADFIPHEREREIGLEQALEEWS